MAGPDPGTPAFGRWQQRLDDAVAGLLRDTEALRAQVSGNGIDQVRHDISELKGEFRERREHTWRLALVILSGVVLPILGAGLAALFEFVI